jgi:hypothetical protein
VALWSALTKCILRPQEIERYVAHGALDRILFGLAAPSPATAPAHSSSHTGLSTLPVPSS